MQRKQQGSLALILMLVSGGVYAAIGDGKSVVLERPSQVHQTAAKETSPVRDVAKAGEASAPTTQEAAKTDPAGVRQAGAQVCDQVIGAAAQMSETFTQIRNEILPKMMQTGEEFARQVEPTVRQFEPTLREFADRLRDLALQMERSLMEPPEQAPKR